MLYSPGQLSLSWLLTLVPAGRLMNALSSEAVFLFDVMATFGYVGGDVQNVIGL